MSTTPRDEAFPSEEALAFAKSYQNPLDNDSTRVTISIPEFARALDRFADNRHAKKILEKLKAIAIALETPPKDLPPPR